MNRLALIEQIQAKQSVLCLGLDPDPQHLPAHLLRQYSLTEAVYEFCSSIVQACEPHIVAVKPNFAFFEALEVDGLGLLKRILAQINPNLFIIGDGKRGDIGNTSLAYASAGFLGMGCHGLTVNPYMGEDSITPFLNFPNRWAIVLGLTSNQGASDFQLLEVGGTPLYMQVMRKVASWATPENLMFVVGATRPELLKTIRNEFPDHFFLVPGVGAQGGNLKEVLEAGLTKDFGLLINASRSILFAGNDSNYLIKAKDAAMELHQSMRNFLL